jgi:inositol 3-alpha-galactosyltransferase
VEEHIHGHILPRQVNLLSPRAGQENKGSVAERFKDTFTKSRAFQVCKLGFTWAAFLNADMAVFRNPDEGSDLKLPGRNWLGANQICYCNLDEGSWAPVTECQGCGSGSWQHPSVLEGLDHTCDWHDSPPNKLKIYQFSSQDFLVEFFRDRWMSVSCTLNAIKSMRYWYPRVWSDDVLVVLHYVVDKPWDRLVDEDGITGHLGGMG